MTLGAWHEVAISSRQNRSAFDCGDAELNTFLRQHARQNHERGASKTFLAVPDADPLAIWGFYSICPASLEFARTPELARKGLARHAVPVFRLARLAVDHRVQGLGLGGQLILSAGNRCLRAAAEVGGVALLIDAKSDRAAQWYASYGAIPLADAPRTLVLPLTTITDALRRSKPSG